MSVRTGAELAGDLGLLASDGRPQLFHGTVEPLQGKVRPGGYDQVFWTAASPAIAQAYMPASGGKSLLVVCGHELDQLVRPSRWGISASIVRHMGFGPTDVEWSVTGIAQSWRVPKGYPTNREMCRHLEGVLGYTTVEEPVGSSDRRYWIKTGQWDPVSHQHEVLASSFKMPGQLLVVEGFENLRLLDISRGDSDLGEIQYHRLDLFARARDAGLDGVVIDDFAQTTHWGNVGHRSIGFFGTDCLRITRIPAARFDHPPTTEGLRTVTTPEYEAWRAALRLSQAKDLRSAQFSPNNPSSAFEGLLSWRRDRSITQAAALVRDRLR